ncbi:ABC transporter substrate-binding protein [Halalkalibacterium halodurans]|uniref:ABC transporter substrate-binding protein n=1 Tax=Halalkalibacterium halodurans TaxID=86665 RepID=UPI002AAA46FB|nr:ABC transporter substrate-binding protein [Halalkalibacterium halodurans]MDY7224697.1 ABC transporter substrate-binding protein [Halalkalibacterium halodurans]MDY7243917.1 ABC transporter substrate-binding protein [Halalkalibacterium halodurans]
MKSNFRFFNLFLLVTFSFILTACEDSEQDVTNASSETDPITLTVFDSDSNPDWENMNSPVGQKIKKDTGVTLDVEFDIEGGRTKIPLMVASGEYPDLILPKSEASTLVEAGALIDLAPLIEEHAPNIKEMLGDELNRLKWSKEDPSIYILSNNTVDEDRAVPNFGVLVQHDVVRKLGYPEMNTLEDLENAIREYKKMYPEINGQPTIGLTLQSDGWRFQSATLNSGFMMTGGGDDGEYFVDPETYEAILHYRRPEEKEVFRWYNHMNNEGLLDPESFVQKHDQWLAKLSTGRALATIAPDWMIYEAQSALRDAGMEERMYGMYPITLNEEYKHNAFRNNGFQVGWGIGITRDCKDPVRAIKFLDYLVKEETQIMLNWGIEGEHYEVVDGKRVIPEDVLERRNNDKNFLKETGIGYNFARFAPRYGDGALDSTGQTYTINSREQEIANQTEIEREVLNNYGVEVWKDLYPSKDELIESSWGAAYNIPIPAGSKLDVNNQRMLDIAFKRVPQAILSDPDQFDEIWDQFMRDLDKVGVEESEEEFTQIIRDTVELWNN